MLECSHGHVTSTPDLCPFCLFHLRDMPEGTLTHVEYLVFRYPSLRGEVERLLALDVPAIFSYEGAA